MTQSVDKQEIRDILYRSISDALMIRVEQISESSRIFSDLAAESIDIVDVRFRLEQELGIKIDQRAMTDAVGKNLPADEFDSRFTVGFVLNYIIALADELKP